ncbi:ras-related protein Rab-15 isoform X1 [Archocentrus centrarchus]|uniref:ras-related protein Rab-15 isoform X1 n=1 Tax=Archocentrus centrarchus TaxID=63155 RepID=UPI0011EA5051|nr:ras-related protein Rab-15 isoform X1 [Archocentrus centrarchus]
MCSSDSCFSEILGLGKQFVMADARTTNFNPSHISTIGVDFKMKTLLIDGIKVRIQIWDTAGQERYQTITKQYYRRAQGIFLVYDITSERSFQHIMKWASDVDEYAPDKVQKILVGNKSDEVDKRQVATEQGVKLAKAYGMDFFETSAFTNHNISETFTRLAEQVLAANKKDLDLLRTSINDELNLAALEEEEGLCDSAAGDQHKGCWC